MNSVGPTCIASSNENPRSLVWGDFITPGHWEIDIVGEIDQVFDSLLDRVELQTFNGEIWTRVAETIESMFKYNCSPILLLCCVRETKVRDSSISKAWVITNLFGRLWSYS